MVSLLINASLQFKEINYFPCISLITYIHIFCINKNRTALITPLIKRRVICISCNNYTVCVTIILSHYKSKFDTQKYNGSVPSQRWPYSNYLYSDTKITAYVELNIIVAHQNFTLFLISKYNSHLSRRFIYT